MMGYGRIKTPEEILQKYWNEAEGEMTFELIVDAMTEYGSQFDDDIEIATIEDPFEYE